MRVSSLTSSSAVRVVAIVAMLATPIAGGSANASVTRAESHATGVRLTSASSRWRIAPAPLPPQIDGFSSLSCGSAMLCLSVAGDAGFGQVLLRSTDGGVHWKQVQNTPPAFSFIKVSCVNALRCMATLASRQFDAQPSRVATSTDGGQTWLLEPPIPLKNEGPLQCVTASTCYLFNEQHSYLTGGIEVTSDFGQHWAAEHVSGAHAGEVGNIAALSCPTTSTCVAAAHWRMHKHASAMVTTSNGGGTWTVHSAPTAAQDLSAVSCGSASNCLAIGGTGKGADAVGSSDGGMAWHAVRTPSVLGIGLAVACTSPRTCLIGGQVGEGITSAGVIARTANLGRNWTTTKTTTKYGYPTTLSCPTARRCVATRESSFINTPAAANSEGWFVSANSGVSWRRTGVAVQLTDLQSVACPTTAVCFAAGGTTGAANDAVVLRSGDAGDSWQVVLRTGRLQSLDSISCPSARECVAVGTLDWGSGHAIARTSDGGRHWRVNAAPDGMTMLTNVSCPITGFCLAIGRTSADRAGHSWFLRSTNAGRRWTAVHAPKGVGYLLGLSCASRTTCTAVGDALKDGGPAIIERTTDGGLRWRAQRAPHGATVLDSVACPDTRTCYAFSDGLTAAIDATHNGGAKWLRQRLPGSAGITSPSDLACMTSQDCAGVGLAFDEPGLRGRVFGTVNGGSTWRFPTMPPGTEWLLGIGCSQKACIAVGEDGQILLSPPAP